MHTTCIPCWLPFWPDLERGVERVQASNRADTPGRVHEDYLAWETCAPTSTNEATCRRLVLSESVIHFDPDDNHLIGEEQQRQRSGLPDLHI